jgi:hypothetical protein
MNVLVPILIGAAIIVISKVGFGTIISIVVGGAVIAFVVLAILSSIEESRKHARAKREPLTVLREDAEYRRTKAIERRGELDIPAGMQGVVYALFQKKVLDNNNESNRDPMYDYYDGNAMKIGYTTRNIWLRVDELCDEYGNRVFEPSVLCTVKCCYEVEQETHKLLKDKELWREMFDVTPNEAALAIKKAVQNVERASLVTLEQSNLPSPDFSNCRNKQAYKEVVIEHLYDEGIYDRNTPTDLDEEIPF